MFHSTLSSLTFLIFALLHTQIESGCRESYFTFCDDLDDVDKEQHVDHWVELVVGREDNEEGSQLHEVDFKALQSWRFPKLTTLIMIRQLKEIKMFTFSGLPRDKVRLNYLKLYKNQIKRIRFTTFDNMNLRTLSLTDNGIEYFHKGTFYNCYIKTIDLSNNKLEMIENGVFNDEYLRNGTKELILRNNNLESIQNDAFPTSLEILNLDYNNLKFLGHKVFENLVNLVELTVSHNKLTTIPATTQFKYIGVMDFSYNSIILIKATDFNELEYLLVLDLSHNRINYPLVLKGFTFPERVQPLKLSLAFNRLTHLIIEENSLRSQLVYLYGNPWDCKCWAILEKFMADQNVLRPACDVKYFGLGQVPYCIYGNMDCNKTEVRAPDYNNEDIEQFLKVVKRTEGNINCTLAPRKW